MDRAKLVSIASSPMERRVRLWPESPSTPRAMRELDAALAKAGAAE